MVRVFGLLIAALALMAPANAALIVRYDFTADASATVDPSLTAAGGSASTFGGSAGNAVGTTSFVGFAPDTGVWRTNVGLTTGQSNSFTLTAGSFPVVVDNIRFSYRRQSPGTTNVTGDVSYTIGAGSPVTLDPFAAVNGVNTYDAAGTFSFLLAAGESVTFNINYNTNANGVEFGFVELQGSVVPEPASMAIFGLMGAGLAVRRYRRK